MKCLRACVIVALVGSFASFAVPPVTAQTSVIDIGTLPGPNPYQSSGLWSVNDRNQAVGWCEVAGFDTDRAILWDDGRLIDLGTLPGDTAASAWSVNERGQVVGVSVDHAAFRAHAFRWEEGEMSQLTAAGAESCYAFDINNHGDAAGACDLDAYVWTDEGPVRLPLPVGYTWGSAAAINDAGLIAGTMQLPSGPRVPVRWRDGVPAPLPLPPGATSGVVNAINARGVIVGYVTIGAGYEPVLWENDLPAPLAGRWGGFQGYAWGINDRGEIAVHGWASPTNEYGGHVWRDGVFQKLAGDGSVQDINNRGVVVGQILTEDGLLHGAVWPKALTRMPVHGERR
jgi:probable HAF family extracellular repeat protein